MGYDSEKREIKMGMLAEKTHPYIRDKVTIIQILTDFSWGNCFSPQVVEMLVAQGFSQWEAAEVNFYNMDIAVMKIDCNCRCWRRLGRTHRRTCRSRWPATWELSLSGSVINTLFSIMVVITITSKLHNTHHHDCDQAEGAWHQDCDLHVRQSRRHCWVPREDGASKHGWHHCLWRRRGVDDIDDHH